MEHTFTFKYLLVFILAITIFTGSNAVLATTYNAHNSAANLNELAPPVPTGVRAIPSLAGSLTIQWAAGGAEGITYHIETSASEEGLFMSLASVQGNRTSYRHTGLSPSQTLHYRIRSFDGETYSDYSPIVKATTRSADYVYKIMPLGDSNTEGHHLTPNNVVLPVEDRAAYRSRLSSLLKEANINFDFVGSRKSGRDLVDDDDHAGFPGLGNSHIASILRTGSYTTGGQSIPVTNGPYLDIYNPDIILLHIGTNGVSGDEVGKNSLRAILDEIDEYERRSGKEVTVVLSKIILRVCYGPESWKCYTPVEAQATIDYNKNVGTLANERIASGDRLVLVDMADAGLKYTYQGDRDNVGDMADNLHPVQEGYDKMSKVWSDALFSELVFGTFPVELASFDARVSNQGITLEWRTASEKNNSHFVVQRMQDSDQFVDVATVAGSGTSSVAKNYSFTDRQAPTGTLYYRLKQIDFDGSISFSKVVTAQNFHEKNLADRLYPNPGDGRTIELEAYNFVPNEQVTFLIYDSLGKQISQLNGQADATGTLKIKLNFQKALAPGLYFLSVPGQLKTRSHKFLVK